MSEFRTNTDYSFIINGEYLLVELLLHQATSVSLWLDFCYKEKKKK